MNEEMKESFEERIDDVLRNLNPSQQITKLKELLSESYDTSYDLSRRIVKAIKYIKNDNNYEEVYCDGDLMIYKDRLEYELLKILKGSD